MVILNANIFHIIITDKSDYDFVDPPCTDHSNVSQTLHQVNLSDFLKQTLDNKYFKSKITSSKI